jgi:hypothetical protein
MGQYVSTWTGRSIYRRSPEELAAVKAKRAAAEMHCQCCGRSILANNGKIAHHGYERPGTGWQTASCMGARYLPFEVARDRLGDMIKALERHLADLRKARQGVVDEVRPLQFHYTTYGRHEYSHGRTSTQRYVDVDRASFDDVREAYGHEFRQHSVLGFDDLKQRELNAFYGKITQTIQAIEEAKQRYAGWKQTHRRDNDQWVAV